MDNLRDMVRNVVQGYAGKAYNGHLYMTVSPDGDLFTVVGVGVINGQRFVNTGIVVRVAGNIVVIERDQSDKIVLDALMEAGVPRNRIVLAYAGEPVPESA